MFTETEKARCIELQAVRVTEIFANRGIELGASARLAIDLLTEYCNEEDHTVIHRYFFEIRVGGKILQIPIELYLKHA